MGMVIAAAIFETAAAQAVAAFAINMLISAVIAQVFAPDMPNGGSAAGQQNPGNRQQVPPAGNNKLPVLYGSAYIGGTLVDLSISADNQHLYWVLALAEVTGSENGGGGDIYTFGNIYWAGKKVVFGANGYSVTGLLDESTGQIQDITGYMDIYLYRNGSNLPTNNSQSAIAVMSNPILTYQWDSSKNMPNCAFAIVHLQYSQSRNLTSLQKTNFQVINPRDSAGDCIQDYLTSARYGAGLKPSEVDAYSITALNTYSNSLFNYINYAGNPVSQHRFKFNGTLDTNQKIMTNIQAMSDCCDCLVRYNEVESQWGVVVQTGVVPARYVTTGYVASGYVASDIALDLNDSNIISGLSISPFDLSSSFNQIETKFPDVTTQDNFSTANFDLAVLNPVLMYPNEPINKQSVSLMLCNNNIQAQYLANRMLKAGREDLQISCEVDFTGLQLEAGNIVTVTNTNYGWNLKFFRVMKVTQRISDTGQISVGLTLHEYNPSVYDDVSVVEFQLSPNTGFANPIAFGTMYAPTISTSLPTISNPAFYVDITSSSAGITQYAELWYSAYASPTDAQRIFAGTTAINSSGDPYGHGVAMPSVGLFNIPAGNWYFFSRMVNNLGKSNFSPASSVFNWRPTTFQFTDQYLSVAYADDLVGTGFSLSPRGKTYYGLANQSSSSASLNVADYKWYLASPAFGTVIYLVYSNRTGRKFSFDSDYAAFAGGSGAFVPTSVIKFNPTIWQALQDGTNVINLDYPTGQVIQSGTTTVGTGQVKIVNTTDGKIVASLDPFLNFGGASTYTGTPAQITIDIYGRVVGFTQSDNFYFTDWMGTATSGQTVFTPTARAAGWIVGQSLIYQNGCLLDKSEYSETSTTFTLSVGATAGDILQCDSFRAVSSAVFYETLNITVLSVATPTITWNIASMPWQTINAGDILTFANTGSPTQYTVSSVNYTARTITFTAAVTATAGNVIYRYRAVSASYPVLSRYTADLVAASSYAPTTWQFNSGSEWLFMNGTVVNDQDYNIVGNTLTGLPSNADGKLTVLQFAMSNLTTPVGTPVNVVAFTASGIATYSFPLTSGAFDLFANGVELSSGDYTEGSGNYTFTSTPTNSTTVLFQQTFARIGAA
jgi:hypothetical protein